MNLNVLLWGALAVSARRRVTWGGLGMDMGWKFCSALGFMHVCLRLLGWRSNVQLLHKIASSFRALLLNSSIQLCFEVVANHSHNKKIYMSAVRHVVCKINFFSPELVLLWRKCTLHPALTYRLLENSGRFTKEMKLENRS